MDVGHVVVDDDVSEEMDQTHLGHVFEVVLSELLIELGAGRFLLYFVGASFYLIDALPKLLLFDLESIYLFFQLSSLFPQLSQGLIDFFFFLLEHQNLIL